MTRDQIIERVAAHLSYTYCEGDPSPDNFDRDAAAAIVDMLGPKELEWGGDDAYSHCNLYEVLRVAGGYAFYDATSVEGGRLGARPTLEAALDAAQAHHEEQHWIRTRIWEDE